MPPDECYTRLTIYDDGKEERANEDFAPGSMAARFKAAGGLPIEISQIVLIASQDEEDERPLVDLYFYEAGGDEPNSTLPLGATGVKKFHSSLGGILRDLS